MPRSCNKNITVSLIVLAAWGILSLVLTSAPTGIEVALSLNPAEVISRPYTLLTYAFVHANVQHAVINIIIISVTIIAISRSGMSNTILPLFIISTILAGLTFCCFYTLSSDDTAILIGASAPTFALATFACVISRRKILLCLVILLAIAGLFGGNAGGGISHCAGITFGLVYARILHWLDTSKASDHRQQIIKLKNKVHTSGYSSLSNQERKLLSAESELQ